MMDLDSAIQHYKEQVQEQAKRGCYSCAEEHRQLAEWLKELKAYREQSGDAISRQAVLNGLASIAKAKAKSDAQKSLMGRVMFFTEQLPSVSPQQRAGRWIQKEEESEAEPFIIQECSECGEAQRRRTKYCPNCGAKMEAEDAD